LPVPAQTTVAPPLDSETLSRLSAATEQLDQAQLLWASGYLAGLAAQRTAPGAAVDQWTIVYGTETGNCRALGEELSQRVQAAGLRSRLLDLRDYRPGQLRTERKLLVIVATHGLGEPPDGAEDFFDYLLSDRVQRLEQLSYAVLALGDSSYEDFCTAGRRIDARLAELGAQRICPRADCDVDFETTAESWMGQVLDHARSTGGDTPSAATPVRHLHAVDMPRYSRKHPFAAEVLTNQRITGRHSSKEVRHIELSLEASGLDYLPGDALGVVPRNPEPVVKRLIELLQLEPASPVVIEGEELPLVDALRHRREITQLSRSFVEAYARHTKDGPLATLLGNGNSQLVNTYLAERQVVDIIEQHPHVLSPQELIELLRKLTPRLYSIASSPDVNPGEAHLTVGIVRYHAFGHEHLGSASGFLADETGKVPVFVQQNPRFRLPRNPDTPMIMVGAGTGIAPFRAFIEHRQHHGAAGRNWLIFGDRNARTDFLYQLEWQRHLRDGTLDRMDVAFSRDQAEKMHVQHRIREHGRHIYDWLQEGAHLYVCGDATGMAAGVHEALIGIAQRCGGHSADAAESWLRDLRKNDRYQRDVY